MKNKKKYKFTTGIQQIEMDTPDYSKAYEIQTEGAAKNKGLSQAASMFSGAFAPAAQVGGVAADVIRNRAKNKKTGSVAGGALEMGASGAALGMQLGGPWGALAGGVIGGVYGGIKGKKDYEKVKAAAQEEERLVEASNFNKGFQQGASTDAQSFLAKKGKYKVKSKQPRLIETEGREPIFSPKKADGSRDLLYYNPNDPTHEEGGVKAVVMPKKKYEEGTNKLEGDLISKVVMNRNKDKDFVKRAQATNMFKTWDDFDTKATHKMAYGEDDRGQSYMFPTIMNSKNEAIKVPNQYADYISSEGYKKATGMMAVGSKQLKVNNLNTAALSQNLSGMPSANAANNFLQPTVGLNQVARRIKEERRQEKINTPRSHKKAVGPVKTEKPPTLYEMKPPPPKSTFNTKNDFNKGSKRVKVYR